MMHDVKKINIPLAMQKECDSIRKNVWKIKFLKYFIHWKCGGKLKKNIICVMIINKIDY